MKGYAIAANILLGAAAISAVLDVFVGHEVFVVRILLLAVAGACCRLVRKP